VESRRETKIQKLFDNWYTKDGKVEVVGYYKTSLWNDSWGGGYELRSSRSSTDYTFGLKKKYVYPKMKFIPVLKRNGLKTSIHGLRAHFLFIDLIKNPKIETLFKAKQYDLVDQRENIDKYWPSIKICLRHNYKIKDARMYFDYIEYLKYFNKDVRNPFYACPKDLHKEHDRYMDKKNKAEAERQLQERLAKIKEEEDAYKERCGKYMGLSFKKDNIEVSFINSVRQLAKESLTLHHCAYSSRYHERENILMFSVRVDGKVKATGAVNIDRKNVAELRGQNNWQSEHNTPENRLIGKKATALLQDNMVTILNGHRPKRKVRKKRKVQLQIAS
jgi:hypothetical protein